MASQDEVFGQQMGNPETKQRAVMAGHLKQRGASCRRSETLPPLRYQPVWHDMADHLAGHQNSRRDKHIGHAATKHTTSMSLLAALPGSRSVAQSSVLCQRSGASWLLAVPTGVSCSDSPFCIAVLFFVDPGKIDEDRRSISVVWFFIGERNLAGEAVQVDIFQDVLTLGYHQERLSRYSVEWQPDDKHFQRVGSPRLYQHRYQSAQLELWPTGSVE